MYAGSNNIVVVVVVGRSDIRRRAGEMKIERCGGEPRFPPYRCVILPVLFSAEFDVQRVIYVMVGTPFITLGISARLRSRASVYE